MIWDRRASSRRWGLWPAFIGALQMMPLSSENLGGINLPSDGTWYLLRHIRAPSE